MELQNGEVKNSKIVHLRTLKGLGVANLSERRTKPNLLLNGRGFSQANWLHTGGGGGFNLAAIMRLVDLII